MAVAEVNKYAKIELINEVSDALANFVISDDIVSKDFDEYMRTIGSNENTVATTIPYIFERNLNSKSIIDIFSEKNKNKTYSPILKAMSNNFYSIFCVKKITKTGFELFSLVNEKNYSVTSPIKMTAYRGLGVGQYIFARIFNYENEYFIIELSGVLPANRKKDAMQYALTQIVQTPEMVYRDNAELKQKIEQNIKSSYDKFINIFGSDEVTTSNKNADNLIEYLNGDIEDENYDWKSQITDLNTYKFMSISEFSNPIINKSLGGFSSHKETYDVTLIFDKDWGFYAIPFYKTFCKFLEGEQIEKEKDLVYYILNTSSISKNILSRFANKYSNFMEKINSALETNYSYEELINEYKSGEQAFSSTSVLKETNIFNQLLSVMEDTDEENQTQKVGRNDPCPCGSGKKYKKCCMLKESFV